MSGGVLMCPLSREGKLRIVVEDMLQGDILRLVENMEGLHWNLHGSSVFTTPIETLRSGPTGPFLLGILVQTILEIRGLKI